MNDFERINFNRCYDYWLAQLLIHFHDISERFQFVQRLIKSLIEHLKKIEKIKIIFYAD